MFTLTKTYKIIYTANVYFEFKTVLFVGKTMVIGGNGCDCCNSCDDCDCCDGCDGAGDSFSSNCSLSLFDLRCFVIIYGSRPLADL
jgi:hypothetical protein